MAISFKYTNPKPDAPAAEAPEPDDLELDSTQEPELGSAGSFDEEIDLASDSPEPLVLNEKLETEKGLGRFLDFVKAHMQQKNGPKSNLNPKKKKGVNAYNKVKNPFQEEQKGLQLKKSA